VLQEAYLDASRQLPGYLHQPNVAVYIWLRQLAWERLLNLQRRHLGAKCRAVQKAVPLPAESSALFQVAADARIHTDQNLAAERQGARAGGDRGAVQGEGADRLGVVGQV
jgi:hypothetical protein